jgi:hypothetical protein
VLLSVVTIVEQFEGNDRNPDELEIDFDRLKPETLRELDQFVKTYQAAAAATEENSTPMNYQEKKDLSTAINMLSSDKLKGYEI